ncbi:MAG: host attachment protein [Deltaproteobacteria bacterium]|nr:host attachment protein [Deltaproteobacteria bacterium]
METIWVLVCNQKSAVILSAKARTAAPQIVETIGNPDESDPLVFARRLAAMLESAADMGGFDRLVVMAPAPFLASLEDVFHAPVRGRIALTIQEDIAEWPMPEIVASVRKIIDEQVRVAGA